MIEQYNIISSTAAGGVPTSTAKIETPDEFAQKIENAIVHKYIESPNGRGGVMVISKDYIPAGKIIAARDAAIREECEKRAISWIIENADTDWVMDNFSAVVFHRAMMDAEKET